MRISVKIGEKIIGDRANMYDGSQTVNFFYFESGKESFVDNIAKTSYDDLLENNSERIIVALNYTDSEFVNKEQGISDENVNVYDSLSVLKREIWNDDGTGKSESIYHPVSLDMLNTKITDFNILNNRTYEYILYYSYEGQSNSNKYVKYIAKTGWEGWTLTELHETGTKNEYSATKNDVWKFKYNISTGETQQQFSKTQQDTLSAYPVFSIGPKRSASGSVSCLLGSEMLPYSYSVDEYDYVRDQKTGEWKWVLKNTDGRNVGGYKEWRTGQQITSNKQVDMLNDWREICYSGNPKLLRDQKGNGYIIQIVDSSDQINDTWEKMPISISFSWVKIGDIKDAKIVGGA